MSLTVGKELSRRIENMDEKYYEKHNEAFFLNRKVRTLKEMQNGYAVIAKGTICKITRKYGGFDLNTEPCDACGVKVRISRVGFRDVELVE